MGEEKAKPSLEYIKLHGSDDPTVRALLAEIAYHDTVGKVNEAIVSADKFILIAAQNPTDDSPLGIRVVTFWGPTDSAEEVHRDLTEKLQSTIEMLDREYDKKKGEPAP